MSNTLDSCSKGPSKPLRDARTTQNSHSRSSFIRRNPEAGPSSRKQRRSIADKDNVASKRQRRAGASASGAFKDLYDLWFDTGGNKVNKENYLNHFLIETELFKPKDLSKILYEAGAAVCHVFEKLHDLCFDKAGNETDYLKNLIRNNPSNKVRDILYENVRKAPSTLLDNTSNSTT